MTTFPFADAVLGTPEVSSMTFTTTALNGLTTGSRTISDTTIDNTGNTGTGRYPFIWLRVILGSHTPTANDRLMIWLLPGDGTNWEEAVTSADPPSTFLVMNRVLRAAATARTLWAQSVRIWPVHYKLMVKNASASVALAGSGCSVAYGRYALSTRT